MSRKVKNKWVAVTVLVEQRFYVEVFTDSREEMFKAAIEILDKENKLEPHEIYAFKPTRNVRLEAAKYVLADDDSRKKLIIA